MYNIRTRWWRSIKYMNIRFSDVFMDEIQLRPRISIRYEDTHVNTDGYGYLTSNNNQCSSSSSDTTRTHDVFVSFRGEDTRNNFTAFLFQALCRKGIDAFKDDTELKKGESIAPELLRAIEGSRLFIVVFSKNYASSTWCLRELAHICNCIQTTPRQVLPIFYDVDPSEVRKQSGCYEKAFAEHKERFREDKEKMEEVQRWREALTRVANLSGWDIQNKPQYAEIEEIVQKITNILGHKFSSLPNDDLVGMESRLEELANYLHLGLVNDVRVVGISGMGGIGKTTLGRALFERISHQYDFRCYIDDVSKIYRDSGTLGVQKQILSQSVNEKNLEICNVSEGTCLLWTRLRLGRALIVLDNVDQVGQLKMFTGNRDTLLRESLGGGSKIIIISRDQHILKTHGVDDVYHVQPLNHEDAVQLFCRNAFKSNYIMSDFQKMTFDVLSHANGHPLAIEVLGSTLFGRDVLQWRSALVRLRENKNKSIMDVLRLSFDELEDTEKEIFVDIACFFNNYVEDYVKEILDFRGFHPEYGLQVLVDKSLITIKHGEIQMHDLLRDLGKYIVREKSPKEPGKWSRLWDYKDFSKVLSDNMEAENLEAIDVRYGCNSLQVQTTIMADALSKMSHLKLLKLTDVSFSGSLKYLSKELGYLTWSGYPFECLPSGFQPDNLVELILPNSSIKQLWEGTKPLPNLRRLILSHNHNLIELPDFGAALNLEMLDLEGCIQLRQIDPSIGLLRKLIFLNLNNCKNLLSLPNNILGLNSLEYLILSGCSKLQFLDEPRDAEHLKKLNVGEAPIHSQSASSHYRAHKDSVSCLLPSMPIFPCMHELNLSFCNLQKIPDAIGNLCCLERLDLSGNNFATLPNLKELSKLYYLNIHHCKQLKYLPELPSQIDFPSQIFYLSEESVLIQSEAGLYIFNCPELVERERCTNIGFSWMIQNVQAHYEFLDDPLMEFALIQSVTPGSEIPRWFNNQHVSMGNCITIDASPIMHDKDWIGIVCCAVIMVPNETVLEMGPSESRIWTFHIPVNFYGDPELVSDESDHTWLFFLDRTKLIQRPHLRYTACLGGLRGIYKKYDGSGFHVEVKKYGYRWIYKQDLELPNLTMMQGGNSSAPKRNFLAIEQNEGRNQGKRRQGRILATRRKDVANSSMENTIKLLQNQFANLSL